MFEARGSQSIVGPRSNDRVRKHAENLLRTAESQGLRGASQRPARPSDVITHDARPPVDVSQYLPRRRLVEVKSLLRNSVVRLEGSAKPSPYGPHLVRQDAPVFPGDT
jgi:hypothetical protein